MSVNNIVNILSNCHKYSLCVYNLPFQIILKRLVGEIYWQRQQSLFIFALLPVATWVNLADAMFTFLCDSFCQKIDDEVQASQAASGYKYRKSNHYTFFQRKKKIREK